MRQTFLTPGAHRNSPSGAASGNNHLIQFNVIVYDSGLRQLSAKAIVGVEILPVNDNDCKFEQSLYEARVRENAQPDTVVAQVRANDLDYGQQHNSIHYQLLGDLRDLFAIDSRTGVITVSARGSLGLDRELLAQPVIMLTVVGRDEQQDNNNNNNNSPSSSSSLYRSSAMAKQNKINALPSCTTTVKIHVDDVNDNPPLFAQKLYEITAYDTDTVDVPLVKLLVHDEDLKHQNSSSSSTNSRPNSYRILSGNVNDAFNITPTGMIYVTKPLNESIAQMRGQPFELRVQVKQQAAGSAPNQPPTLFTDECLVRVHYAKINRNAPEWRLESLKSVAIAENSRPGTLVAQLKCTDRDYLDVASSSPMLRRLMGASEDEAQVKQANKKNQELISPIRYWIKENGANVLETNEFKLDSVTGQLTSRVELDREQREFYQLIVACEDNGRPQSLESITPLYVTVLDVDDNRPEFVVAKQQRSDGLQQQQQLKGKSEPNSIELFVEEHQSKGLQVGELRALDRDLDSGRTTIFYCLVKGNDFGEFVLDQVTGILYTNETLDRERQASYELLVKAINDGSTCDEQLIVANSTTTTTTTTRKPNSRADMSSFIKVHVHVLDINDNAPTFKRATYRAGIHHRALMNTLVTQVAALDPDHELNGTLNYRISEILLYKTNPITSSSNQQQVHAKSHELGGDLQQAPLSKPIKLIQSPFKIDQSGNVYTQQLLTQYQLMSMFVLHIEVSEQAEPWRVASTKLEIYIYETNSQLKIRINLHPRFVETYRYEIESMLSNATKYKAIINRARSYYGNAQAGGDSSTKPQHLPSLDLSSTAAAAATQNFVDSQTDGPSYCNIHAIFIDHHRLVNPNLVMERFDLTSAQQFTPQSLLMQQQHHSTPQASTQLNTDLQSLLSGRSIGDSEMASLIDKIQSAEFHTASGANSFAGIDWLESPSVLYVALTSMLALIGLLICLIGCCCTSRIKDHIIKVAMDKLVKQQTLQAKINERVLAATNQAYANSTLATAAAAAAANGSQSGYNDFLLQQNGGGLMSSFDATKGCVNNNYENMNILQRAMEAGEFIDPNYTTLGGGPMANHHHHHHLNLGAHFYDASELEQQQQQRDEDDAAQSNYQLNGDHHQHQHQNGVLTKQVNGSVISVSLDDDEEEEEDNINDNQINGATEQSGDLNSQLHNNNKKQRPYTNGVGNGGGISHQRQRQQVPDHLLNHQLLQHPNNHLNHPSDGM